MPLTGVGACREFGHLGGTLSSRDDSQVQTEGPVVGGLALQP